MLTYAYVYSLTVRIQSQSEKIYVKFSTLGFLLDRMLVLFFNKQPGFHIISGFMFNGICIWTLDTSYFV